MTTKERMQEDERTAELLAREELSVEVIAAEKQADKERRIAECHQMIGRIQASDAFGKLATVAGLMWLKDVKESKVYRDLPGVGTWEDFCNYVGKSRRLIDEDLQNLGTFGEQFLATVAGLRVGYRDLRRLRPLITDGSLTVGADAVTIDGETIPLDAEHVDDLGAAIERILEQNTALTTRVEKLEKKKDEIVAEETKGLKTEVKALVREVERLKAFDPEAHDREWSVAQMEAIREACEVFTGCIQKFVIDPRLQDDRRLQAQVYALLTEGETSLRDLRSRIDADCGLFDG